MNSTSTGTELPIVLLLPSEPSPLEPQHQTPPSATAQVWSQPALIAPTPLASPDTGTGTVDPAA